MNIKQKEKLEEARIIARKKMELRNDCLREFDSALVKMRVELENGLNTIDVLDKNQLKNTLEIFNQRLVIFQHDFLRYLKDIFASSIPNTTNPFNLRQPGKIELQEMYAALTAGGGSALLVSLVTVQTTTWLVVTTEVSLAALIGTTLGVSAGVATAGVGLVAGAAAGIAWAKLTRNKRRTKLKDVILKKYTDEVENKLRKWADGIIAEKVNEQFV